jgi:outer membrane protein OmpA-like peptidoglycan-associated protein
MALNLKKDDGISQPNNELEEKKSKYNLSKKELPVTENNLKNTDESNGKSKLTLILFFVILFASGIWYMTQKSISKDETLVSAKTDTTSVNNEVANSKSQDKISDTTMSVRKTKVADKATQTVDKIPTTNTISSNSTLATFDGGSSNQTSVNGSILSSIEKRIKNNPNVVIILEGYASSEGDLELNLKLSQERADNLKTYLISKGILEKNIVAKGMGIQNPIASNDTEEGRKKNRRVQVK